MRSSGTRLALLAGLSFAVNNVITKLAYDSAVDVHSFMALRTSLSALLVWLLAFGKRSRPGLGLRPACIIGALGAVGYAGQSLLFSEALKRTTASATVMGLYVFPVVVAILSLGIFGERLSLSSLLALLLGLAGVFLAIGIQHEPIELDGAFLALLSGVTYGILILFISRATKLASPMKFGAIVLIGMSTSLVVLMLLDGTPGTPTQGSAWLWIALSAIAVAVGITAFAASVAKIGPTRASIGNTIEPPATALLAGLILGDSLSLQLFMGIAFVVIAIILLRSESIKQQHAVSEPAASRGLGR